jgi:hypothetical protein
VERRHGQQPGRGPAARLRRVAGAAAADGRFTDPQGRPLALDLSARAAERDYAVLAGAPALHAAVVELLR